MQREAKLRSHAQDNRELVLRFFRQYPFCDQTDCAEHTGLSRATVNRHVQALKAELRQQRQQEQASA